MQTVLSYQGYVAALRDLTTLIERADAGVA